MTRKQKQTIPAIQKWYVYIMKCSDGSYYTGVTTDVDRRRHEHNNTSKGAKYTRCRRPVKLIYFEKHDSRQSACRREYAIKQMKTAAKKKLVSGFLLTTKSG